MCHKEKNKLKGTNALEYIKWGEKQGFHERPSCRGRQRWWDLGEKSFADFLWFKAFNDRFLVISNADHLPSSDRFYSIFLYDDYKSFFGNTCIALNSMTSHFFTELNGRVNLGEGALDNMAYEARKILIIQPSLLNSKNVRTEREIKGIFEECGINPEQSIRSQKPNPLPGRKTLDDVVFDILGLTQEERDEVYWAVCELVKNRLEKARSV
jgi:hypothetical protein